VSYDESKAKDLLFMIDGSRSMGGRLGSSGMTKIRMVKEGLMGFVAEKWPVSYFPWPLRFGVNFYRLLGTPGGMQVDVVVPLNPPPATLELYRLDEMRCKGGSPLADAVRYAVREIGDSMRNEKVIKLISDGENDGRPVKGMEQELRASAVPIDAIELSNSASLELREIARLTHGTYTRPQSMADFQEAIRR
jgi:Mg-chelatase subunit ChlD